MSTSKTPTYLAMLAGAPRVPLFDVIPQCEKVVPPHPRSAARLLTVVEFAEAVGIGRTAVYELMKLGLPAPLVPHVGRRIDLLQGRAWMVATGMQHSRKERRRGKGR